MGALIPQTSLCGCSYGPERVFLVCFDTPTSVTHFLLYFEQNFKSFRGHSLTPRQEEKKNEHGTHPTHLLFSYAVSICVTRTRSFRTSHEKKVTVPSYARTYLHASHPASKQLLQTMGIGM